MCARIKALRQDLRQAFSPSQTDPFKAFPGDVPHSEHDPHG